MQREDISEAICVPPKTLARRAKAGRFNTLESDRLVSLVVVFEDTLFLIENDKVAVTEWICSPVRALGSKRPIEMLGARVETKAAFDLIEPVGQGVFV